MMGCLFELLQLGFDDIGTPMLREAVDKECNGTATEEEDRPITSRPALSRPGDALFNDSATQVRINLPSFGPRDRGAQCRVGNP